jgi:hypothetical protein
MWECPYCKENFSPNSAIIIQLDPMTVLKCPHCSEEFMEDEGRFLSFDLYDELANYILELESREAKDERYK